MEIIKEKPSIDSWVAEAKNNVNSNLNGMYLIHNGVVRSTSKFDYSKTVKGITIRCNSDLVEKARLEALNSVGINFVKVWINEGDLSVGDDIMIVLVAGDNRPNVIEALISLVKKLKTQCITETEKFSSI